MKQTRKAACRFTCPVASIERTQWQELAVEGDHCTVAAFRVFDCLHVELEVDRADDAVAELFMHQGFQGGAVDLDPVSYTHLTLPTTPYV